MSRTVSDGDSLRNGSTPLVPFLFGVSGRAELTGPQLTRLLCDLGVSTAAARASILRLRRTGDLVGRRDGRVARYRMAGAMRHGAERVHRSGGAPVWDGGFAALLHQVPERHRAFRDALRRAAILHGYGILQQGVLISPVDRHDELAGLLAEQPAGAQVQHARLVMTPEEAARAAVRAWSLAHRGDLFREQAHKLERALRAAPAEPQASADTLRRFHALVSTPIRELIYSPALPAALLPDDWALPRMTAAIEAVDRHYQPAVRGYLDSVLAAPDAG